MARLVGSVLEVALLEDRLVMGIGYDNASTHELLDAILLGVGSAVSKAKSEQLPFFSKLIFVDVGLKMFPYHVACFVTTTGATRPFYGARDPPHILKSASSQMRSCARRLLMGEFFVDTMWLVQIGLPLSAYTGKFSQSDKHAEMIFATVLYENMPCMGYGTLVFALLVVTLMQAWWDDTLDLHPRLVNALFVYHALAISKMLAEKRGDAQTRHSTQPPTSASKEERRS
jgi:hypothetical protein